MRVGSVIKIPGACESGWMLCGAKHVSYSINTMLNSIGSSPCVVLTYLKDSPGIERVLNILQYLH